MLKFPQYWTLPLRDKQWEGASTKLNMPCPRPRRERQDEVDEDVFQALSIATKITKGTVEIISEKKVLNAGDKADSSTAALLQKLTISPFYYKMEVKAMAPTVSGRGTWRWYPGHRS